MRPTKPSCAGPWSSGSRKRRPRSGSFDPYDRRLFFADSSFPAWRRARFALAAEHFLDLCLCAKEILTSDKRYQKIEFEDGSFLLDGSYKLADISPFTHSLEIIKASNIHIHINEWKKTIGSFSYRGKRFRFVSVTDPEYRGVEKSLDKAYLIISIPTDDRDGLGYFKFIAAIFPIE